MLQQQERPQPQPLPEAIPISVIPKMTVLVIGQDEKDRSRLQRILSPADWYIRNATTFAEAKFILENAAVHAIICEPKLPDGDWKDILRFAVVLNGPPQTIVASRLADDRLWAEVLCMGGYDVLLKPFDAKEVVHVLTSASLHQ